MHEPLSLILLANGFIPGRDIAVPEGREFVYYWAGPLFLSFGVLSLGLWFARVRHVQTGPARALLWVSAGCLAVSCTAWGIGAHQETGVFYPGWVSWFAFPGLLVLAVGWWLVWHQLTRPGPLRPRLEVGAWCLTVGYAVWWLTWLTNDLNWMHWGWQKSIVLTMPWLWAGACGLVVWGSDWRERSAASRQIRAACIVGAVGGLVVLWLVSLIATVVVRIFAEGVPDLIRRGPLDRELQILVSTALFGVFAFAGAALGTWLRRGAWQTAEQTPAGAENGLLPNPGDPQPSPTVPPASTSSG